MRLALRYGSGLKLSGIFVPTLKNLFLTANSVLETVTSGTTVGALTFNQAAGSTFSLIDNAGGRFALVGTNINTLTLPDVAVNTVYKITVQETNAGFAITSRLSDIYITVNAFVFDPGTTLSAPVVTRTTANGLAPEVDITIPSNVWAGYYLNVSRSATGIKDGTGAYTVPTLTVSYQIQPSDLPSTRGGTDGGITKAALAEDGYLDPTGLYYQQYWFSREDGVRSAYSNEITDTVTAATTVLHTTNGVNKNTNITVTNRNAEMPNLGINAQSLVRATQAAAPNLFVFEVEIVRLHTASTPAYIFIEDGATAFGPSVFGIPAVGVGLEINAGTGTTYILNNGGFFAGGTLANGDFLAVVVNKTTKEVKFFRTRAGTTTQLGATQTAVGTFANWFAALGFKNDGSLTANFGQSAFARTLDVGEVIYG